VLQVNECRQPFYARLRNVPLGVIGRYYRDLEPDMQIRTIKRKKKRYGKFLRLKKHSEAWWNDYHGDEK